MTESTAYTSYPASMVERNGTTYSLEKDPTTLKKYLIVKGDVNGFLGRRREAGTFICELMPENARALRQRLPWLQPVPLGLKTSAGMGDRLGIATPGHVRAVTGTGIAPIFAQQSVRENNRTGRKPQEVLDDAMWGVFQAGWREPWGADADHLKQLSDLEDFLSAGYTFFTVDPGDHVDMSADTSDLNGLKIKAQSLPWDDLKTTSDELVAQFTSHSYTLEGTALVFSDEIVLRSAVKYGRAVAHAARMYRRLVELHGSQPFDFEVSVDETSTPTSIHEHFYIAHELQRLGVRWTSLAPRFVGRFEKGVDYIGDLGELDRTMALHAAVMRAFGNYKLSLHSGSDKFSVYPIAARHTRDLVHLKTAGTSYLEALRVIAMERPDIFRKIYAFARSHYETDRASYHVSAVLSKAPTDAPDGALPQLLDQFDARQVMHVTFGSVLDTFKIEFFDVLRAHESEYYQVLENHFRKHLDPLRPGK